ncbi:hypothetical protein WJX72_001427 [[Myrmecia] bisecta]|uniref:Uncharacterized protein n=1 Tax=[Myrmecia] bisecta TaxID=41462 RepID=A0AAW1Q745_9CHLO
MRRGLKERQRVKDRYPHLAVGSPYHRWLRMVRPFLFLLCSLVTLASARADLNFSELFGGNVNLFYRDNTSAAHTLLTASSESSPGASRLLVAFPADNSGAVLYFNATNNTTAPQFAVTLQNGTLQSVSVNTVNGTAAGIQGVLNFSDDAKMTRALLVDISPDALFNSQAVQQGTTATPQASQVAFLTYQNKFLAGSWRFLTYFGRDTLISLRLFMDRLQPVAIEAAMGSVLDRLQTQPNFTQVVADSNTALIPIGSVCHEETIGDYASWTWIQDGKYENSGQDGCDYKMIDTDWLLLPTAAHYFLELPQGANRSAPFLAAASALQNGTYGQLLDLNVALLLKLAAPFAANQSVSNLIHLREGVPVGNWRDSNVGLGLGRIPYDVNTALVPSALRAIQALAAAGIINSTYESQARSLADAWEKYALPLFAVSVPAAPAQQLLAAYSKNVSVPIPTSVNSNTSVDYYALALNADGSKVPVMQSDIGFNLLYGSNVPAEVLATLPGLLSDYPRGLLSGVGLLVANPAYASDTGLVANLTRAAYHGTVVWGWQEALMVAGVERQLALCASTSAPAWCADQQLVMDLQAGLFRLWRIINLPTNAAVKFSEVWSWSYTSGGYQVTPLAQLSGDGTESNAIQLWSYGFLAVPAPLGYPASNSSSAANAASAGRRLMWRV